MYEKLPNLVIGFHGCSKDVYEKVVTGKSALKASQNDYDWLGNGIYFWENNLSRARDWAKRRYDKSAAVVGAIIDLGLCLNLTDSESEKYLKMGYEVLKARCETSNNELPRNKESKTTKDILLRNLDCAVIQQMQEFYSTDGMPFFDSIRGVFVEGEAPYAGSAFRNKTHVQICVFNPNCIKGYFKPRERNFRYRLP